MFFYVLGVLNKKYNAGQNRISSGPPIPTMPWLFVCPSFYPSHTFKCGWNIPIALAFLACGDGGGQKLRRHRQRSKRNGVEAKKSRVLAGRRRKKEWTLLIELHAARLQLQDDSHPDSPFFSWPMVSGADMGSPRHSALKFRRLF